MEPKEMTPQMSTQSKETEYWKFIIPSIFGILLFLTPIKYEGQITIGVGILASYVQNLFADHLSEFMVVVLGMSAVLGILTKVFKPALVLNSPFWKGLFDVGPFWLVMRIFGFSFGVMTLYQVGPEFIWSDYTGGVVLYDLIPVLTTWFLFAGLLLPLLIEFGLMEFIGTLLRRVMKPLFTLPGRSSIDCLASWMGSGTVGVLVTMKQYDGGFYSQREAAVIATNFSIASIAFSLVVINFIGLGHMFVPFYVTVVVAGVIAAIIMPRIPPLSRKEDTYYEPVGKQIDEQVPEGVSYVKWGLEKALEKAAQVKSAGEMVKRGIGNVLDIWFGLLPLVMFLGTLALIIAEYTPIFHYVAYPLIPILNLLQIPEAAQAAQALVVGFADMFLPAVIGSGIESELTRFVIACLSLTQLIYMSEIGILILRSNLPVTFLDLVIIFIERTLITLPVVAIMAHVFFF
nr:YjiH family protein [Caldalkalibacillus thermarum]